MDIITFQYKNNEISFRHKTHYYRTYVIFKIFNFCKLKKIQITFFKFKILRKNLIFHRYLHICMQVLYEMECPLIFRVHVTNYQISIQPRCNDHETTLSYQIKQSCDKQKTFLSEIESPLEKKQYLLVFFSILQF